MNTTTAEIKARATLIEGAPIRLGRAVVVLPALNIKLMKEFRKELALIQKGASASLKETAEEREDEYMETLVVVMTAALMRNYPDIDVSEVEEGLDFNNVKDATLALLGAAGYKVMTQEEAESHYGKNAAGELAGTM